jgi:6,7-dimethyl-8-ribityllumazine synthase
LILNRETDHDLLIIEECTQAIVRTKTQGQCSATNSIHKFQDIKALKHRTKQQGKIKEAHNNQIEIIIAALE